MHVSSLPRVDTHQGLLPASGAHLEKVSELPYLFETLHPRFDGEQSRLAIHFHNQIQFLESYMLSELKIQQMDFQ